MATEDSEQVPSKIRERRSFSDSFKLKAVQQVDAGAETQNEIAQRLKVARSVLQSWIRRARAGKLKGYDAPPRSVVAAQRKLRGSRSSRKTINKALKLVSGGASHTEVARRLGVKPQKIYRWTHYVRKKQANGAHGANGAAPRMRREAPVPAVDPNKFRDAVAMLKHAVEAMPAASRMDEAHALTLTAYRMLLA